MLKQIIHALSIIPIIFSILLVSCTKNNDSKYTLRCLSGYVRVGDNEIPNAFKVVLTNCSDPENSNIFVTGSDGKFEFLNLEPGYYELTASKDGFFWIWTVLGKNNVIHDRTEDKRIKIEKNDIRNIEIIMSNSWHDDYFSNPFLVLDLNGKPIEQITISPNTDNIAFQLYNATGETQYWNIYHRTCYSVSDDMMEFIPWFTSVKNQEGALAPNESVAIILTVNKRLWEVERMDYSGTIDVSASSRQEIQVHISDSNIK